MLKFPEVGGTPGRPKELPDEVYADRGYDSEETRAFLRWLGIEPHIAKRRTAYGSGLGKVRWVVERTISWLKGFAADDRDLAPGVAAARADDSVLPGPRGGLAGLHGFVGHLLGSSEGGRMRSAGRLPLSSLNSLGPRSRTKEKSGSAGFSPLSPEQGR